MDEIKKPNPSEIFDQLSKILKSEDFQRSERGTRFLEYITNKTISGETDKIKGYTIGIEVFDKPKDFNSDTDASVRVEASRIRKSLALYYHGIGREDQIIIKIPKGSYVPTFSYNILHTQSLEDLTNTPVASPADSTKKKLPGNTTKIIFITALLLIPGLLLYGMYEKKTNTNFYTAPVIIIQPFTLLGDDNANLRDDDSKNVEETLKTQLLENFSRFDSIKITEPKNSIEIQNSDYKLEGSIEKKLDSVTFSLRLLDLHKSTYVWSYKKIYNPWESSFEDWQSETTASVASELASPYGIIQNLEQSRTKEFTGPSAYAYRCSLEYYAYCNVKTDEKRLKVRACLEKSIKDNPNDSTSWAYLSWIYGDEYRFSKNKLINGIPPQQAALLAAEKSVSINPQNPRSHQYLSIAAVLNKNQTLAKQHIKISVSLNPYDSEILADAGWNYAQIGEWELSKTYAEKAIRYNPGHARWYYGALFAYYYNEGNYENALKYALEYYTPGNFFTTLALAVSYAGVSRTDEAVQYVEKIKNEYPEFTSDPKKLLNPLGFEETFINKILIGAEFAGFKFSKTVKQND